MCQSVPRKQKSLLLHMFLTSCDLATCYRFFLIAVITVARHYKRELSNLPTVAYLPALSTNKNTRTRCKIFSKLTLETPERHQLTSIRCL